MKRQLEIICLALAGLSGAVAAQAGQENSSLKDRISVLEQQVTQLKARAGSAPAPAEAVETAELKERVDELVKYVHENAKSAKNLKVLMDIAKEKGFNAGINPDAHALVLQGLNEFADAMQVNLPRLEEQPEQPVNRFQSPYNPRRNQ